VAGRQVDGVAGVLAGLVQPEHNCPENRRQANAERRRSQARPPSVPSPRKARLGRPPGRVPGKSVPKEKVTLRIHTALMSEYREWSWQQRCQLGELIERALTDYRKRRHRPS
jgi:hypothetical protein